MDQNSVNFIDKYETILSKYSGVNFVDTCLLYEQEVLVIDAFEKKIKSLALAIDNDDLSLKLVYVKSVLNITDDDCYDMDMFYEKLKSYIHRVLFNSKDLQRIKFDNIEMIDLFQKSILNMSDDKKVQTFNLAISNKLSSEVCTYTRYLVDNINEVYKFYFYIFDVLYYFDYELLSLELLGYIDEVILFLSDIYKFYSLSKKSVLTYRLIVELEKFRDYHLKKFELLYEE